MTSWTHADLSMISNAPHAADRPFAYVSPGSIARVLYRGKDDHIHELRLEPGNPPWKHADLTMLSNATNADSHTFAYLTPDSVLRALYVGKGLLGRSDGHIHEIRLEPGLAQHWQHADISSISRAPTASQFNSPFAYVSRDGVFRVLYVSGENLLGTSDGHIHEIRLEPGNPPWKHADLSSRSHAPASLGQLFAYATPASGPRVLFNGANDGHLHQLSLTPGQDWTHEDVMPGGSPAMANYYAYVTPDSVVRVVYCGQQDRHIHELHLDPGAGQRWQHADLSSLSNDSSRVEGSTGPVAYVTRDSVTWVLSHTEDGGFTQLSLKPGPNQKWTREFVGWPGDAPALASMMFAYVTPDSVVRVLYLGTDHHIHEVYLKY